MLSRDNFNVPIIHHKILPRRWISETINNALLDEAVFVVAPYGCGKTLAIVSWTRDQDRQATWCELNKNDNNIETLTQKLTEALLSFIEVDGDLLAKFPKEPSERLFTAVAEVETVLGAKYEKTLIIDQFNHITDIHTLYFIRDFIQRLLGRWRVIVISRSELHPAFNDMMLKRRICLITIEELKYTVEETVEYFPLNGRHINMIEAKRLQVETEGWPAAMSVILTVSRGGPVVFGEAARSYVMGFFDTEIWNGLTEDVQDFMLKTSVLDVLSPSSCRAVTDIGASLPVLKWMYQNGLFISRLDEPETYRYHKVFRDFLLSKLNISDIDETQLFRNVGWWFFERGEVAKSFPYFFKSKDLYGLSAALKMLNPADLGIDGYLELIGGILELDINELKSYPVIVARMALAQFMLGNVDEMHELFSIFLQWIDPGELLISPEDYAEYVWEAGWLTYLDPTEEVLNNTKHENWTNYKDYVPHLKEMHRSRAAIIRFPSVLRGFRDYSTVTGVLADFLADMEKTGASVIREEVSIWEMRLILAEYAYEKEDFSKAEEIVRRVIPLVEEQRMTDLFFVCINILVKILRATNLTADIPVLINRLEEMIVKYGDFYMLPNFRAFKLKNNMLDGNNCDISDFVMENRDNDATRRFYNGYKSMTLARCFIFTNKLNDAMLVLGNLELLCQRYNRTIDLIEIYVLMAVALHRLNREGSACETARAAMKLAERYGLIRIISDDAVWLWPVLEPMQKHLHGKYARNVIVSCKKIINRSGKKYTKKQNDDAGLTRTEMKILELLRDGMSYSEIAVNNGISISTVKSHAHSIYSKLEVPNRTSAVIAAIERELL